MRKSSQRGWSSGPHATGNKDRNGQPVKADLEKLMDEAVDNHEPVIITRDGKSPVVLVSLADWNSQQETEYLLRSPANRKRLLRSIRDANKGKFAKVVTASELEKVAKKK
jgi:antitoxin YefM